MKKFLILFLALSIIACGDDNTGPTISTDNFDRRAMLANWADNIIIPAYTAFAGKTAELKTAGATFADDPSQVNFGNLVSKWESAYMAFQDVSMFEIGKAEELRLTNNLNIYPADVAGIDDNVINGDYNLDLPSQIDKQGFPALDYLLFGIADDENAVLEIYQSDINAGRYLNYFEDLTTRINDLTQAVLADWNAGFRDEFVENSGNSATASVDKLVNDYIFYYEKHLRAGKIGIPAGVFSGSPLSNHVEAFYRKNFSKALFNRALDAVQDFFTGVHHGNSSTGESMKSYLDYLEVAKNGQNLSDVIDQQFNAVRSTASQLDDDFAFQVETDNLKMLETYDQLQLNVVNLKVDMLQAFNINVDFVDADGD